MSRLGVLTAILSITSPGPSIAGITGNITTAAVLARRLNDEAAAICDVAPPGRFGFFANLPDISWTRPAAWPRSPTRSTTWVPTGSRF